MKAEEYVTLIPTRTDNVIQWTMVHEGKIGQGQDYPAVDLPSNSPDAKITFTIVDINSTGIRFDPKPVDPSNPKVINAIWISEGSGSQKNAGPYPAQIDKVKLQGGAKELIVSDKNSDDAVFNYQLNFVNPANPTESVTSIDPEIRNGGTGTMQYFNFETVAIVLTLATVLILAGLQLANYRRNRNANAANKAAQSGPVA